MSFITAGSYSRLDVFATCKFRAKLAFVDKIPEPDRGPGPLKAPDGTREWHNDRGSRIHDAGEQYVDGTRTDLDIGLKHFKAEFDSLRKQYANQSWPGQVQTENLWCFDNAWQNCAGNDWDRIWMRIKTDCTVFRSPSEAVVIDYKTGRKFGNEVKHAQQCQLYQLGAFLRYPDLEFVTTELWYLDQDDISTMEFTREQGMKLFNLWNNKNLAMTTCVTFNPSPNVYNCKWCPYKPSKSGHCTVGVD